MRLISGILFILMIGASPAWATLGEYEGSVSLDQRVLRAELRQETHPGYTLHQLITADGAVIREYVSAEGRVFAVTWQGRFLPNLQQLLGSYSSQVQRAASGHGGHGPLIIKTRDFVYFSAGRMMSFYGRAYVPALLPQNVTAEVVR